MAQNTFKLKRAKQIFGRASLGGSIFILYQVEINLFPLDLSYSSFSILLLQYVASTLVCCQLVNYHDKDTFKSMINDS